MRALLYVLPLLLLLAGCATTAAPPSEPNNLCAIFHQRPAWYQAAIHAQEKWGVPPQIPMAIMYQESSFRAKALPPRYYALGFIPWGRVSSAYGYAQAKDDTWADYQRDAGSWFSDRDDFDDAMDFMGWYISKTQKIDGVSKWDAYNQYLAYHEGWTGFRQRSYARKPWLMRVARRVQERAERFGAQYRGCEKQLSAADGSLG